MSFQQVLARKTSSFVVNVLNVRHGILAPRHNVPPAQHRPQQKANIVEGDRLVVKHNHCDKRCNSVVKRMNRVSQPSQSIERSL